MLLARRRRDWPALAPPPWRAALTAADVLRSPPGQDRDAAILDWAADVWACWREQHLAVAEVTRTITSRPQP
jgi:Family of unknown function (DUF5946)